MKLHARKNVNNYAVRPSKIV